MTECSTEGAHRCVGSTYQTCTSGSWQTAVDCPNACVDGIGCVACDPGGVFCKDGNVWSCDASGNPGSETQHCSGSDVCSAGACVNACEDAATNKSYIGCEYWAVDLDNAIEVIGMQGSLACNLTTGAVNRNLSVCYSSANGGTLAGLCDPQDDGMAPHTCSSGFTCQAQNVCVLDAQHSPFAIVVSNPQAKETTVTVTGAGMQTITRTIAAGQVSAILPQQGGIPDQSVDGTIKSASAYKITSTLPIVAYQFNPLDNANVFSNDGSLLIPRTAFDVDYYAMSYPTLNRRALSVPSNPYYGFVTVVAWQNGTQVTVTPTVPVQASQTQTTIAAGTPTTFTLDAFQVLELEASGTGDLTGTHITSPNSMSFGVFGGHEATVLQDPTPPDPTHTQGPCCADHLEEMLFPSTTWGKAFAIARSEVRKDNVRPPDFIRVMAQKPGTSVTFMPAVTSIAGNCAALQPGQFCDVKIMTDTEITSNEPILVGHYLESSIWSDPNPFFPSSVGSGDPSMALAVPTEQYRREYTILVPSQYQQNYVSIAAAATGGVQVDGTAVTMMPMTGNAHRAARVPLSAGQHKITCADGCGITLYGYSDAVSYMFAGGLDLKQIVIL